MRGQCCRGIIKILVFMIVLISVIGAEHRTYGYMDTSLLEEKLDFDKDGNLVMMTHDKKATSAVLYKTVGWVIKRYDMPMNAAGQQYAIIPMSDRVEYRDDPADDRYVYCIYYGEKATISEAIEQVSARWKAQLFGYGDFVYIDEIMTVVDHGVVKGGIDPSGNGWGEVYYSYDGISNARNWVAKENLKTHFDKKIYFPSQVKPKYFRYEITDGEEVKLSHTPSGKLDIGEGTKYVSTYNLQEAVPTGTSTYVNGVADDIGYKISFRKKNITFYIPIKFVVTYKLVWNNYSGQQMSEQKDVVQWYYVTKKCSYYNIEKIKVNYLDEVQVKNNVFKKGGYGFAVDNARPVIYETRYDTYQEHVSFPTYDDEYHIDGGVISKLDVNGVKPDIPDIDRQSIANSKIQYIKVRNDYLKINNVICLNGGWKNVNGYTPYTGKLWTEKNIYSAGHSIPHQVCNGKNYVTLGKLIYKGYYDGATGSYDIYGIQSINVHTPVYVEGRVEETKENRFKIYAVTTGNHLDYTGYGNRDYKKHIDKIQIRFEVPVVRIRGTQKEEITVGEWIDYYTDSEYMLNGNNEEKNVTFDIRAIASNYRAVTDWEQYTEEKVNMSPENYVAIDRINVEIEGTIEENETETESKYNVVGTH